MGGGSVLVGKSKNYEVYISYSSPDEDKHPRQIFFKRKDDSKWHYIDDSCLVTEENQRMLDEFEKQQMRMMDADTLEALFPTIDKEKLTLAEIYQRMVKAEKDLKHWKHRAEEAEGLLYEIGEFHEKLTELTDGDEGDK